jgi:hypothetical protein
MSWTFDYTPTGGVFGPNLPVVDGLLNVSGGWTIDLNGKKAIAAVQTASALTFTASCPTRVTAGTLSAAWTTEKGNTHVIEVTWTACGVHTTTFDGAPIN